MDFTPYNQEEILVTYVKDYPGRFEKLTTVRKAMYLQNIMSISCKINYNYN